MTDEKKKEIKKDAVTEEVTPEASAIQTLKESLKKKSIKMCLVSATVSVCLIAAICRLGGDSLFFDNKQDYILEQQKLLDGKIKDFSSKIESIESNIEILQTDLSKDKENHTYVYSSIASIQKDVEKIKDFLHISETKKIDENMKIDKKLPAEVVMFLNGLHTLVNDGAPFDGFLEANQEKIDMQKYTSASHLLEFKGKTVKSYSILKKELESIAKNSFDLNITETFWEKQSRILKEKICNAFKIQKKDKDSKDTENQTDKETTAKIVYDSAILLSDDKLKESIEKLRTIPASSPEIDRFIQDAESRLTLDNYFKEFFEEVERTEALDTN